VIEIPDSFLDVIVERLAAPLAKRLAGEIQATPLPTWMRLDEAVEYTRIPKGTFEKLAAEGFFKGYGGKTKVYNREELDKALKGYAATSRAATRPIPLRKAS
jgi:hypothetical protein